MNPFLSLWIDPDFAALASGPGVVLAAGIWLNGIAMIPYSYLQGTGRPDVTAKCHLLEILPHAIVLWICIRLFGAVGAAAAMLAVTILDTSLLMAFARMRIWRTMYFWQGAAWIVAACAVGFGSYAADRWRYAAAFMIVGGAVAWAFRLSPELGSMTVTLLRRVPVPRREG
jgi:O-antigen/teichoic acid export membrane protein